MALVAIVGRPNVGKSTFFNRLIEARQAVVHDNPGVTRDRIYGSAEWNGRIFSVVDTGGYVPQSTDLFETAIREQVEIALAECDVILFVVDVTVGITDLDQAVADLLRATQRPVLIVANKADNAERRWDAAEFYALGLGEVFPISSINGTGTGELLDELVEQLPEKQKDANEGLPRIAFIGKPNVGKSSLTNALIGRDRSIVTDISGTTRDAIDSVITYQDQDLVLVDTAGLRRRAKVRENVEFYSILRTERAIQNCDVAVLLLDAQEGLEAQDIKVLKQAELLYKGLVIAINKWDLIAKETNTARDVEREIKDRLKTLDYVPVHFISALTKKRIHNVLDEALIVLNERNKRIPTSALNEVLQQAISAHHPPSYRNQYVRIKYVTQVKVAPPVFSFFCNYPKGVHESYQRYLENQIRTHFPFTGVPIKLVFKAK